MDDEILATISPVPHLVVPSSAEVSSRMSRQPRRDTNPELQLRRELHRQGLRYRVDQPIPGLSRRRTDITFTRARIAVFVDGCFWHACPDHASYPHANESWWRAKLERNITRDRETDAHLRSIGWTVLRFWEHEDMTAAAGVVAEVWTASRM